MRFGHLQLLVGLCCLLRHRRPVAGGPVEGAQPMRGPEWHWLGRGGCFPSGSVLLCLWTESTLGSKGQDTQPL